MTRALRPIPVRGATALVALVLAFSAAGEAFAVDPALRKRAKDPDAVRRSDAARELGRDGTPDAVTLLVELLDDRSPVVRDAAVASCEALRDPESVAVLAKSVASRDELVRRNVAAALGGTRVPEAVAPLAKLAAGDPSADVRAEALDALRAFAGDATALAAALAAASDPDPLVRAAAVEAAGGIGGEGAADAVRKSAADADEGVRCVARRELRFLARDEALAALAAGAADPSWRVRAQTVEDAAWLRERPAMAALVELTGDPSARVAAAAHTALRRLSGKDLGRDRELWTAWWRQNEGTWQAPRERLEDLPELEAGREAPSREEATRATYHGVRVEGAGIAFVVDFSGSMLAPEGGDRTRWDLARDELTRSLAALPDGVPVNVLLFQDEVKPCFDAATPLSAASRRRVDGFLRATPGEKGDLLSAVLTALRDERVDTLFLLTDGDPSAGEHVDRRRIRTLVRRLNRLRKVRIHTIGCGAVKATSRGFLADLARDADGVCVLR